MLTIFLKGPGLYDQRITVNKDHKIFPIVFYSILQYLSQSSLKQRNRGGSVYDERIIKYNPFWVLNIGEIAKTHLFATYKRELCCLFSC